MDSQKSSRINGVKLILKKNTHDNDVIFEYYENDNEVSWFYIEDLINYNDFDIEKTKKRKYAKVAKWVKNNYPEIML